MYQLPTYEKLVALVEYQTPTSQKTITLKDGKYENGSGADYVSATMLPQFAFGDLNGDGIEDAAVLIGENDGGSGTFVCVYAIINQSRQPVQSGAALIDDRPNIKSLSIKDGRISVGALIHGFNDVMTNPTFAVTETYQLAQSGLKLVHFTSQTADGAERAIQMDGPASGAQVSGSVEVKGSISIAPFENTLGYLVDDDAGNNLDIGSFTVNAKTAGGPATFDATIALPSDASGKTVWLLLNDFNAADGSTIVMEAIALNIK